MSAATNLNGSRWRPKNGLKRFSPPAWLTIAVIIIGLLGGGARVLFHYSAMAKAVDINSGETILVKQRLTIVEKQAAKVVRIQQDIAELKIDISKQTKYLMQEFSKQIDRLIPFITPTRATPPGG